MTWPKERCRNPQMPPLYNRVFIKQPIFVSVILINTRTKNFTIGIRRSILYISGSGGEGGIHPGGI